MFSEIKIYLSPSPSLSLWQLYVKVELCQLLDSVLFCLWDPVFIINTPCKTVLVENTLKMPQIVIETCTYNPVNQSCGNMFPFFKPK